MCWLFHQVPEIKAIANYRLRGKMVVNEDITGTEVEAHHQRRGDPQSAPDHHTSKESKAFEEVSSSFMCSSDWVGLINPWKRLWESKFFNKVFLLVFSFYWFHIHSLWWVMKIPLIVMIESITFLWDDNIVRYPHTGCGAHFILYLIHNCSYCNCLSF